MFRFNTSLTTQRHSILALTLTVVSCGCLGLSQTAKHPPSRALQGTVRGGRLVGGHLYQANSTTVYRPPVGSIVKLYQVGTTGYGSSPNLLAQTVTGSGGTWNIATFTCSPANAQVYLIVNAGNTGFGDNTAIKLMAVLGPCDTLPNNVNVNEVTTVASVWAVAQFMKSASVEDVGSPSTNASGLANAARTVSNLTTLTTGKAPGNLLPSGATEPIAKLNTLANIAAACVQSTGVMSSACQGLFGAATPPPPNNVSPTDTLTALLNITKNPASNAGEIFALSVANPVFKPLLPIAPTDWTLAVNYTGGGLDAPKGIAIDGPGNIWITNPSSNTISEFTPAGLPFAASAYSGGGLSSPQAVAVDHSGHVWVTNSGNDSLSEFGAGGAPISSPLQIIGGGINFPVGIAVDNFDNIWVANCGNACNSLGKPANLSQFTSAGAKLSPNTGFTGGGLNASKGLAVDVSGNLWIANAGNNSLSEFNSAGVALSPAAGFTGGGLQSPFTVAVDPGAKVWVTNPSGDSISSFDANGVALSPSSGITDGGLNDPRGIASDSAANKWVATNHGAAEFDSTGNALSPSAGFVDSKSLFPQGIAIDRSGNVWIANMGDGRLSSSTLSEFVGAASPVLTPLFGPPDATFDNMNDAGGFFDFIVVETVTPGHNVSNPPGYLKPTATANGDGTVTLAVQDGHSDTTEDIVDFTLPGGVSNPYIDLASNRFLQFNITNINSGHFYDANILFFGPGTNPTYLSEAVWLVDSTNMHPTLDVTTLAPPGAAQYFLRFRLFPFNVPANVFTLDSISTSP